MSQNSGASSPTTSNQNHKKSSKSFYFLSSSSTGKVAYSVQDAPKAEATISSTCDIAIECKTTSENNNTSQLPEKITQINNNNNDIPPISSSEDTQVSIYDTKSAMDSITNMRIESENESPASATLFIGTVLEGHSFSHPHTPTLTPASQSISGSPIIRGASLDLSNSVLPPDNTSSSSSQQSPTTNEGGHGNRSSFSTLTNWWSSTNQRPQSTHEKSKIQEHRHVMGFISTPNSPRVAVTRPNSLDEMDWEPTGPEADFLHRSHTLDNHSSSSLPLPLSTSTISHPKLQELDLGRKRSSSQTRGSLSSMLWGRLVYTQDTKSIAGSPSNDKTTKQSEIAEVCHDSASVDGNPVVAKESTMTTEEIISAPKERKTIDPENSRRKRWSIFGYGSNHDNREGTPPSKLRKKGDVLIETESSNIESISNPPQNSQEKAKLPHEPSQPINGDEAVTTTATNAPNRVAHAPHNPHSKDDSNLGKSNSSRPASSTYAWLNIIPNYRSRSASPSELPNYRNPDHQSKSNKEDEVKDVNNDFSRLENNDIKTTTEDRSERDFYSKEGNKEGRKQGQTFAELKESKAKEVGIAKELEKSVSSLSKAILSSVRKNIVLPDYYEQYPSVRHSQSVLPGGEPNLNLRNNKPPSIMESAVNAINSLLFSKEPSTSMCEDDFRKRVRRIKKVVIIGVHGWFPMKLIRSVVGEPTGTSKKFCEEMDLAVKSYFKLHHSEFENNDITLIPLEGEGKVMDRVEILYQKLVENKEWIKSLENADLVLVSTHSQGTPTSTILISRLIKEGMIRTQEDDPRAQQIGMLAMAGISHGPFPYLKGNVIVRWFEAEPAQELFDFMNPDSEISKKYHEALRVVLSSGARITVVASLEDQVVPLYSAVMSSIYHPSIVRAVYINGASYQDDFLTNLISFTLRLRNSGVDDHGVLLHLSEVIAGSIYGEGHSSIYEEREVYTLAIRAILEPPSSLTSKRARSEPVIHPLYAKQNLNPFYLPWGMRGVIEDIKALGDDNLDQEVERLKNLYDQWTPVSKGMKEIKFRLEPVRSRLI